VVGGPARLPTSNRQKYIFFHLLCVRQFNSTSEETFSFRTPPFHWNHLRSSDKLALRNSTKFLIFFFTNSSVTLHPKENYWFLVGLKPPLLLTTTQDYLGNLGDCLFCMGEEPYPNVFEQSPTRR
jgi:hypothetical protein